VDQVEDRRRRRRTERRSVGVEEGSIKRAESAGGRTPEVFF